MTLLICKRCAPKAAIQFLLWHLHHLVLFKIDDQYLFFLHTHRTATSFIIKAPKTPNDSYAGVSFLMNIEYSGPSDQPDQPTFTYKPNPSIKDIVPKTIGIQ